jgi:hypothetical protein
VIISEVVSLDMLAIMGETNFCMGGGIKEVSEV